jgi:hypothetical protein
MFITNILSQSKLCNEIERKLPSGGKKDRGKKSLLKNIRG